MSTPMMQASGLGEEHDGLERPPSDVAAEQSVLGGMMLSPDVVGEVTEVVTERDFYQPAHSRIYAAVLALYNAGDPVDPVAVAGELERRGDLRRIGGAAYLHTLIATVPTAANAGYYARLVAHKAQLRRLIEAGLRITQLGYQGAGADLADVVDRAQAAIHDATTDATRANGNSVSLAEATNMMLAALDNTAPRDLVRTGLYDVDDILGGLEPGEITVVCGRPGHGKTLFGLQILRHAVLDQGKHAVIISLEMSREQLTQRISSATAGVLLEKITRSKKNAPALTDDDWQRLTLAAATFDDANLHIYDSAHQTTASIRTVLRRHAQQHGVPDVVMIDYLSLITPMGRVERRDIAIGEMTRDLKILAGELGTSILLLHQLNRGFAQRMDKRPKLSDLRDSGAVEQDAFAVLSVYTPAVSGDDPDNERSGESDIAVLKNRQGQDGCATVAWQAHYARFGSLAGASTPQPPAP